MADITLSDGRLLRDLNRTDARGFPIFEGPDGALFTQQPQGIVLSRPARISDSLPSTGDPTADELLRGIEDGIDKAAERGRLINEAITFSPEELSSFLDQAVDELSPFFQSQFKAVRQDLEEGLAELGQSFELAAQGRAQAFRGGLRDIRETAAERGLGISGIRARQEREFAESTQRGIESASQQVLSSARIAGREAESQVGTRQLQGLQVSGIRSLDISGFVPGITFAQEATRRKPELKPLFELSKDITGTLESQFEQKKRARATELEGAARERRLSAII